jgi:hypothetical protein
MNTKENIKKNGLSFGTIEGNSITISPKLLIEENHGMWLAINLCQTEHGGSFLVVPETQAHTPADLSAQERFFFGKVWADAFKKRVGTGFGTMLGNFGDKRVNQNNTQLHGHIFSGDILTRFPFVLNQLWEVRFSNQSCTLWETKSSMPDEEITIYKVSPNVNAITVLDLSELFLQEIMKTWLNKYCQLSRNYPANILMVQDGKTPIQFFIVKRENPRKENNPVRKFSSENILKNGEFISSDWKNRVRTTIGSWCDPTYPGYT